MLKPLGVATTTPTTSTTTTTVDHRAERLAHVRVDRFRHSFGLDPFGPLHVARQLELLSAPGPTLPEGWGGDRST